MALGTTGSDRVIGRVAKQHISDHAVKNVAEMFPAGKLVKTKILGITKVRSARECEWTDIRTSRHRS